MLTPFNGLKEKLIQITLPCKYFTWYVNICQRAIDRSCTRTKAKRLLGYVEGHHFIPQSVDVDEKKNPHNIVYLTAREHFICHWLLTKMFEGKFKQKMFYAFAMLLNYNKNTKRKECSAQYKRAKQHNQEVIKTIGAYNKGIARTGKIKEKLTAGLFTGMKHTQQSKNRMSISRSGKNNHMFGKEHLNQTKEKISKAMKGKQAHNKGKPKSIEAIQKRRQTIEKTAMKFSVYKQNKHHGDMTLVQFCEKYGYGYYNAYSSVMTNRKYFDWTFTPI